MTSNFSKLLVGFLAALALAACSSTTNPTLAPQDALEPSSSTLKIDISAENLFTADKGAQADTKGEMLADSAAEGGDVAALRRGGEGARLKLETVQDGLYELLVRSRADAYQGWPTLRLRIDGEDVGDKDIEHEDYSVDSLGAFTLKKGQLVEMIFLNDAYSGPGKDRNLYIDYLELELQSEGSEPPTQPNPSEPDTDMPEGAASVVLTNLPSEITGNLSEAERNNDDFAPELQAAIDYLGDKVAAGEFDRGALRLPAGEYALNQSVSLRTGVGLYGDGVSATSVVAGPDFPALPEDLNDGAVDPDRLYRPGYLFDLNEDDDITFDGIAFSTPNLLGVVVASFSDRLTVANSAFSGAQWSALRLIRVTNALIERNTFVNAGGSRGGNGEGGSIFGTWIRSSTVRHNLIDESTEEWSKQAFGIKGRQWYDSEIAYNTILLTQFSIELPFENDHSVEIHHNVLGGPVSMPKAGVAGIIPDEAKYSFYLHHNVFFYSYSLEGPRNDFIIEENVFAFSPDANTGADKGNLVSTFGNSYSTYPEGMVFKRNLILNPGRGIFWSGSSVNELDFSNNYVYVVPTINNRTNPMFDFRDDGNTAGVTLSDNVIEMDGVSRPLLNDAITGKVKLSNNKLVGVSDADELDNPQTGAVQGLGEPLRFSVGVDGAYEIDSRALLDAVRQGEDLKALILR